MIKNGFLFCPSCGKKIMRIEPRDIVLATLFCRFCKARHRVEIRNGTLIEMEENIRYDPLRRLC